MNINLYNRILYSEPSSSSSSDLSSSTDEFFWDPILYPSYIYPIEPVVKPDPVPEPVKEDNTIDLSQLFKVYNETMTMMSTNLKAMEKIYRLLNNIGENIPDSDFESIGETRSNLVPKIKSSIDQFKPIILDSYIFRIDESTKNMVATMNNNVVKYNKAYNEIIGINKNFKEYSDLYTKLMGEFEKS